MAKDAPRRVLCAVLANALLIYEHMFVNRDIIP